MCYFETEVRYPHVKGKTHTSLKYVGTSVPTSATCFKEEIEGTNNVTSVLVSPKPGRPKGRRLWSACRLRGLPEPA